MAAVERLWIACTARPGIGCAGPFPLCATWFGPKFPEQARASQ